MMVERSKMKRRKFQEKKFKSKMNCCSVSLLKAEFDFSANENYSWKWLRMKERLHCSHGLGKGLYTHKFQYWNVTEIETDTHSHWIIYVSGSTSDGATNSLSPFWFSIRICNWARISHEIQSNAKVKRQNEKKNQIQNKS